MQKFLIDTEFIRATKDRVHFIEIAMLDKVTNQIKDFHFDARLNSWEHRYFTRALNGHYGKRTQAVFEAVDTLHSGKFNRRFVADFCHQHDYQYEYSKLPNIHEVVPNLKDSMLYAWDISNDKDLFKIITVENYQLVDVQAMWRQKFGGNQLSLIDAYKHVLFNLGQKDTKNLIAYAHYACCDVMLLDIVVDFIESYESTLQVIPVERSIRDKKIIDNNINIQKWIDTSDEINLLMQACSDPEMLTEHSRKLIRFKKKIAAASKRNAILEQTNVYEIPWW